MTKSTPRKNASPAQASAKASRSGKVSAKKSTRSNKTSAKKVSFGKLPRAEKLAPPKNGAVIRMYRQGHGDCFLLAFPRRGKGDPVYVLIDCGYKPGSPGFIPQRPIGDIVQHIHDSTGGRLDLFVITHEHQDHLNGIWKKQNPYFGTFKIDNAWFAWTENPKDELANQLRERHKDQLLGLIEARRQLALAAGEDDQTVRRLDGLLSLEFGGEVDGFALEEMRAAAKDPTQSVNKQAMKLVKDKAGKDGVAYLNPGGTPQAVPGTKGVRAFVMGPPRSEDLLVDEDPVGTEGFPRDESAARRISFWAAAASEPGARTAPFASRYQTSTQIALEPSLDGQPNFFREHYGQGPDLNSVSEISTEAPDNAAWRRIDTDWLFAAENFALQLNRGINNTSLVLAFELPKSKKILLFAGDAQRGNWISWDDQAWQDGDVKLTCRDLLRRTVLYKVGHHGSHNATLAGTLNDEYPNLSWMAQEQFASEFTAMITAVNKWAMEENNPPWVHPLPSIKTALEKKAHGRVFQTDTPAPQKPDSVSLADWDAFLGRATMNELYFDLQILDA